MMEEPRYDIIFNDQLVSENSTIQDALMIVKALTETYYEEVKYAKNGIQIIYHGVQTLN